MNSNTFDIASCINSSTHNGTYQYRYVKNPNAIEAMDATALQQAITAQQKDGYRLISTSFYINAMERSSLLFERDSENATAVDYKVFSESVIDKYDGLNSMNRRLSEQNKLGWILTGNTSVYVNDPKAIFNNLGGSALP